MPSFNLTGFSSVARTLGMGEAGFVGVNGALVTDSSAISQDGSDARAVITVLGTVQARGSTTISFIDSRDLAVFVGEGANVISTIGFNSSTITSSAAGIFAGLTGSAALVNHGTISGNLGAVVFRADDDGISADIYNTGAIFCAGTAITVTGASTFTDIFNSGEIVSDSGTAISVSGTSIDFTNSGHVVGRISVFSAEARIVNTGLIEGDILLSGGNDFLDSRGGQIVESPQSVTEDLDIRGGAGDDIIFGSDLSDVIEGQTGEDRLRGYTGDDEINGGDDNDDVRGGAGDDFVLGDGGDDMVHGGSGDDRVRGNAGNDEVRGGSGDDVVTGGSGDDIVAGGRGNDSLYGNSGADVFEFNLSAGFDIIHDYRDGLDLIDLSDFGTRFNRVDNAMESVNGNAVIDLDALGGEGTIVVLGAGGDLNASDFIF